MMTTRSFDVIIIGAGPAGVAAAGSLAGHGISVALIEAGSYAGAENWSGCVYFAESLAEPDCFGPAAVQSAPFERPVVRRGTLMHNGLDAVGAAVSDPALFPHCYTVLRPVYDPYFAHLARSRGVTLITATSVTALIRKAGRVVGVSTDRGPLYSAVVFIAEGDASHLVRSEDLERVSEPHYLQGIKAVYILSPTEIEKRFSLDQGQGAAYEILVRNGAIAGRSVHLNMGGFLYTNRDSLSLGCVVPLENLKRNYRGDHSLLLEWMRSLPWFRELTAGAELSSYGAKIIRSGGWRERPVLIEDGLAVGGAATGFGIDIPFPNFTGPAAASGLFFGRAVRALLKDGRSLDRKNLSDAYLAPLKESVYGRNARYLADWPRYFSRSRVLFGRTADLACGASRFLSSKGLMKAARFLRTHVISPRGLRELAVDNIRMARALRLGKLLAREILHPLTWAAWLLNLFRQRSDVVPGFELFHATEGAVHDLPAALRRPFGTFLKRMTPAFAQALSLVYSNDGMPLEQKFRKALRAVLRALRLTDLVVLPAAGVSLSLIALAAAIVDAVRYYVLRIPAEKFLAEPVMAYGQAQRTGRAIDAVRPERSLEAKLATNTYHVGRAPHIRTLWPARPADHGALGRTGLWWVCPARVYGYDAPFAGRGPVTVNWENCIKCESCWRAEPGSVLWGRFTDHRLVYRPATAALPLLLGPLADPAPALPPVPAGSIDTRLWYASPAMHGAAGRTAAAAAAFMDAVDRLPLSAGGERRTWPAALGKRLCERLAVLEKMLHADGRHDAAQDMESERKAIELRLHDGRTFPARYGARRLVQRLYAWMPQIPERTEASLVPEKPRLTYDDASRLFPDRVVKEWEEGPMPDAWAEKIRTFIARHRTAPRAAVRALSAVSPALGLIACRQLAAARVLASSLDTPPAGVCMVEDESLEAKDDGSHVRVRGTVHLVPAAACTALLLRTGKGGVLLPLAAAGVTITPTPAIGFRAAGLSEIRLECTIDRQHLIDLTNDPASDDLYLAIALGAGDYLSRRASEHAAGRVQFPGQMLDTEGRDGIAKLGAVKALVARVEAWRLALEALYDRLPALSPPGLQELGPLCAALAARAFGPERGCMAYDAGQVFGGFAYSEDDLLSRFYRDSALFPVLAPGAASAEQLHERTAGADLSSLYTGELGTAAAVNGEPLALLAGRWRGIAAAFATLPGNTDPAAAGSAAALMLGIRTLIIRVEKGLENGAGKEHEAAAVEVLLGLADDAVMTAVLSAGRGTVPASAFFPAGPDLPQVPLDLSYRRFCALPGAPHRSGDFLRSIFDRSPRYVPEMQLHDKELRPLWEELTDWFREQCSGRTFDGLSFERHVERLHDLPPEIIAAVRSRKWLATYIPGAEDGLGWPKASYYVLNSAAGSFGDAAVCLLIMASTSIGTTPVLLGLEDELPRVREELEPLAAEPERLGVIGSRIRRIVASFRNPNPARIRKDYEAAMALVDGRIRRTRVVKYLAANFLKTFYGAGIAGQRGDFAGFQDNLSRAAELFDRLLPDVRNALDELPRRDRAHRLFLRSLGHGGVSAFALTEPTAGSDSGGVKTTAVLRTAVLSPLPDGRYGFSPTGEPDKCLRYLIDADRITFTDEGMAYRTPDGKAAPIRYDRYDYATDRGVRYYEHSGSACEFHDIGQVRESDKGLFYEYYSLTGAKMWITNGSIATQFSLFAQAPEGVTGFMVDRHAEGLTVGADERKMGQRGSPTNEISLDGVRVPREGVIGYEGHGQVNALETLNTGRCGLAVVAGALVRKAASEAAAFLPASPERDRLLGEAAAIQFGSESVAYYLIGLFDRPHESVRMESAIAKFLCSEDLHDVLALVERAYGPEGMTERYLLEKARRDARILNIYEGTNEVQRFLILKDLIAMAADWIELPEHIAERPDDAAMTGLATWKNRLGRHVKQAATELGDTAWMDAMLQPGLFLLAEMAGEVLRLECVWHRMEWLCSRIALFGSSYTDPLMAAGRRAADRAVARLEHLDRTYGTLSARIFRGGGPAEVRCADAFLDAAAHAASGPSPNVAGDAPDRVLCIVRPVADLPPAPRLDRGRLRELLWQADPGDRSALDQVLARRKSGGTTTVDVLLPGGPEHDQLLRTCGAGANRLIRLDSDNFGPAEIVDAVRALEKTAVYDLIVCGSDAIDGGAGLAAFLAGSLGRKFVNAETIDVVMNSGAGGVVLSLTAVEPSIGRDMGPLIDAYQNEVLVLQSPSLSRSKPAYSLPAAVQATTKTVTTVGGAAEFLASYGATLRSSTAEPFSRPFPRGTLHHGPAVWAVLDPGSFQANIPVLRAARTAAGLFGTDACCLIPAPRALWPALAGLARSNGSNSAFCVDTGEGTLSLEGRYRVLDRLMSAAQGSSFIAPLTWNDAFAMVAGAAAGTDGLQIVLNGSGISKDPDGTLTIPVPAYGGKLIRQERVSDGPSLLTIREDAELPEAAADAGFTASAIVMELGPAATMPLPPEAAPSLSTADVIIDLGYGIRDESGLELARELAKKLEALGLAPMLGATRKVTQDLKLLPLEAQIGQTGVQVNPKLIIALGISGAPQHIDWIGTRADVLCFNKDTEAPLMKLNQTRPAPRIHPVPGDLFVTVRELIGKLGREER